MKGILLAGGSGSRLYPLTSVTSKQLLPVYDKPMIYYPLSTLMLLGIQDILVISTPHDIPNIQSLLGDGAKYGVNLSYKVQNEPKGIAEAFILGDEFIGNDDVCLILGDNIFHIGADISDVRNNIKNHTGGMVFGYHVKDPERFGVIEWDKETNKILSIVEKPSSPKSSYAAVGLYMYDSSVVERAKNMKPSARGELEITDLNALYLAEGKLSWHRLRRGAAWLDAGTPLSLLEAATFVATIEHRQWLKIGCPEEIAFRMGYIDKNRLSDIIATMKPGLEYRTYLERILTE